MNSVIFYFLSLFCAVTGGDPCENSQMSTAFAEECAAEDSAAAPEMRRDAPCVTDISNGF